MCIRDRPERSSAPMRAAPLRWVGAGVGATALQRSLETVVHVPERFRAVAPSAVLRWQGRSPDSSSRDARMIHDPRRALSRRTSWPCLLYTSDAADE